MHISFDEQPDAAAAVASIKEKLLTALNHWVDADACGILPHITQCAVTHEQETDISYELRFFDERNSAFVDFGDPSRTQSLLGFLERDGGIVLPFDAEKILRLPQSFSDTIYCQLYLFILVYSDAGFSFGKLLKMHYISQPKIRDYAREFNEKMGDFTGGDKMDVRDIVLRSPLQEYNCALRDHKNFASFQKACIEFNNALAQLFKNVDRAALTGEFLKCKENFLNNYKSKK